MGIVKAWLLEQAENERRDEVREWVRDRLGREPTEEEINRYWEDFELHEDWSHAISKND